MGVSGSTFPPKDKSRQAWIYIYGEAQLRIQMYALGIWCACLCISKTSNEEVWWRTFHSPNWPLRGQMDLFRSLGGLLNCRVIERMCMCMRHFFLMCVCMRGAYINICWTLVSRLAGAGCPRGIGVGPSAHVPLHGKMPRAFLISAPIGHTTPTHTHIQNIFENMLS